MCPLASLTGACASSNPCHVNAQCSNVQGSYSCECNDGYQGNGHHCCKLVDGELPSMPIGSAMTSSCAWAELLILLLDRLPWFKNYRWRLWLHTKVQGVPATTKHVNRLTYIQYPDRFENTVGDCKPSPCSSNVNLTIIASTHIQGTGYMYCTQSCKNETAPLLQWTHAFNTEIADIDTMYL